MLAPVILKVTHLVLSVVLKILICPLGLLVVLASNDCTQSVTSFVAKSVTDIPNKVIAA